jgi:hypothetical protein
MWTKKNVDQKKCGPKKMWTKKNVDQKKCGVLTKKSLTKNEKKCGKKRST